MTDDGIILPPLMQLALAWQPAATREALGWRMKADQCFADIVRSRNEPLLAQISLAWWREQLEADRAEHPLLAGATDVKRQCALQLVDSWERLMMSDSDDEAALEEFAAARSAVFALYSNATDDHRTAASHWAVWDLARRLDAHPIAAVAQGWLKAQKWPRLRLSHQHRALLVLYNAARRDVVDENIAGDPMSRRNLLRLARIGSVGR